MTTGVVTSVSPSNGGGTLSVNATVGDDVLLLDDAEPFAEDFTEPRFLVIGSESTPREYIATQSDEDDPTGEYVVLAVPLDVEFEAGLPVTPWAPSVVADDKRAVTHQAWVRLDGQDGAIRAGVRHGDIPTTGADYLIGAQVAVVEDPIDGWFVESVYGRPAVVDQSVIRAPSFSMRLATSQSIPAGVDTVLTDWEGEIGTDDNGGETGGAPLGGGGWFKANTRDFRWQTA